MWQREKVQNSGPDRESNRRNKQTAVFTDKCVDVVAEI